MFQELWLKIQPTILGTANGFTCITLRFLLFYFIFTLSLYTGLCDRGKSTGTGRTLPMATAQIVPDSFNPLHRVLLAMHYLIFKATLGGRYYNPNLHSKTEVQSG